MRAVIKALSAAGTGHFAALTWLLHLDLATLHLQRWCQRNCRPRLTTDIGGIGRCLQDQTRSEGLAAADCRRSFTSLLRDLVVVTMIACQSCVGVVFLLNCQGAEARQIPYQIGATGADPLRSVMPLMSLLCDCDTCRLRHDRTPASTPVHSRILLPLQYLENRSGQARRRQSNDTLVAGKRLRPNPPLCRGYLPLNETILLSALVYRCVVILSAPVHKLLWAIGYGVDVIDGILASVSNVSIITWRKLPPSFCDPLTIKILVGQRSINWHCTLVLQMDPIVLTYTGWNYETCFIAGAMKEVLQYFFMPAIVGSNVEGSEP